MMSISPRSSFTNCKLETIPGGFVITDTGNCLTQLSSTQVWPDSPVWCLTHSFHCPSKLCRSQYLGETCGDLTKPCLMAMIPKTSPELRTLTWPGAPGEVGGPSGAARSAGCWPRWSQVGFLGPGHRWSEERPGPGDSDGLSVSHQSSGNVRRERRHNRHKQWQCQELVKDHILCE